MQEKNSVVFISLHIVWEMSKILTAEPHWDRCRLQWWRITFTHETCNISHVRTANEGPVRVQYKSLVPIYVFPEMKLLFLKQNYNVLSPSSYTHTSVRDLYISRISLLILLQRKICGPILGTYKSLTDMVLEIGTETAQFPEKEYINGIFLAVRAQFCTRFQIRPRINK
jgi:hypothetical protein